MNARFRSVTLSLLLTSSALGCGPKHVAPFTPRQRVYNAGDYAQKEASAKPTNGSLFSEANPGLLEDTRAVRVGDFVVLNIDENANAQGDANTSLTKQDNATANVQTLTGILPALKQGARNDPTLAQIISLLSNVGFTGTGTTERSGQLSGSIAVRVVKEMPNGDLFIEGTKVVLINNEEYHLYLSGLIRPTDIAQDNSVSSSRVADAQIEYTGRGDLADTNRRGWLTRLLESINPF
jgi:flagellar L-ring protein precursor FlgH